MFEMLAEVWERTIKGTDGGKRFHAANWFGLALIGASLVAILVCEMNGGSHYHANRPFYYAAPGSLFFLTFLGPVLRIAREEQHRGLKVVIFWGLIGLVVFIITFVAVFSAVFPAVDPVAAGGVAPVVPPGANYDRLLNILPAVIAVWAAALGWYTQHQIASKTHRTSHAFNLIMQSRTSSEYIRHLRAFQLLYPPGRPMLATPAEQEFYRTDATTKLPQLERIRDDNGADAVARANAGDQIRKIEAAQAAKYLLNYYEFMAVAIAGGDLDEDVLYDTIGTMVVNLYRRTAAMRDYLQEGQPLAMVGLVPLIQKWEKRKKLDAGKL